MRAVIFDCFLYAGETEMAICRISSLAEVVDVFVPVLCSLTHQGDPIAPIPVALPAPVWAPLDGGGSENRVRPFVVDPAPMPRGQRGGAGTRWYQHIERQHRYACQAAARHAGAGPGDWLLLSDVDEIPDPAKIEEALDLAKDAPVVFAQRFHSGSPRWLHPLQPWHGTILARFNEAENAQDLRDRRPDLVTTHGSNLAVIPDGGWHFSWFGTDAERAQKLVSFSHAELVGRFDPEDGRRYGYHSNGENLRLLSPEQVEALDWPPGLRPDDGHWWWDL